jgi:hypothetical protein
MAVSVRLRFEIFKRDDHTCKYCGRRSPEVVLEVDHIQPVCEGGSDDEMNLVTSCWDCNRGKGGVPLSQIMTGSDPHDKAIEMLERERQLAEYNYVLALEADRIDEQLWELHRYWQEEAGLPKTPNTMNRADYNWLKGALKWCPMEKIREFMDVAIGRRMTKNVRYVAGCARNWRYEHQANKDSRSGYADSYDGN